MLHEIAYALLDVSSNNKKQEITHQRFVDMLLLLLAIVLFTYTCKPLNPHTLEHTYLQKLRHSVCLSYIHV